MLRDSVATLLAVEGTDLVSLQRMLGHGSVSQTQKYAKAIRGNIEIKHLGKQMNLP